MTLLDPPTLRPVADGHVFTDLGTVGLRKLAARPMYAIGFDLHVESLREHYGDPYNHAYDEIRRVLQRHGFIWQQGSVHFGDERITAVTCVTAAQELARQLPWFADCVRDIRMLRIDDLNDLRPAIDAVGG